MTESSRILYGSPLSGHSHRVELMLLMLGLPYQFQAVSADQRREPAFRRLNPLGQVPVLRDGDQIVIDSNAILVYLARRYAPGSHWLPDQPEQAASVQRWLSIAAGELRYGPASARLVKLWARDEDAVRAAKIAGQLLSFMEAHLAMNSFLAGQTATIADLACYSYVAHAPEGGIEIDLYPAIRRWLAQIEALPGFRPMPAAALPAGRQ